jgi:peptide-methionine (R)-S-oxide reductase
MHFAAIEGEKPARRALLVMPAALLGLIAVFRPREYQAPDPLASGTGAEVKLLMFRNNGVRLSSAVLRKIVRTDAEWRQELSQEQFVVTRRAATELPFTGKYWNTHEQGMYRCACCATALFSSESKFDSGTGWPSFTQPAAEENIWTRDDRSLPELRTEVLCRKCDAHLGHVFSDGPEPHGLRYCLNSAALVLSQAS